MRLIDAFSGNPLQTFAGHLNNKGIPVEGSFSPDSQVNEILNFKDKF
jgi:COMPASS component SWD2